MVMERAKSSPDAVAFRVRQGGAYVDVRWRDVLPRMEHIGAGLLSIPGGLPRSAAVTILGNTRLDWVLADFGALAVGLRTVPVYASVLPEEVGYCHVDTGALVAICEDRVQLEKVRAMRRGFRFFDRDYRPDEILLRHIVVMDPTDIEPADDWESLAALEQRGAAEIERLRGEIADRQSQIRRTDTATYTYTSGTTGPPKAVTQTHDNMLSMLEAVEQVALFNERVRAGGLFLFLPLAHSFGRLIEQAGPYFDTPLVLSSVPTLAEDLNLSKPGFFPGAPRVFEKMKAKIEGAVAGAPPMRQRLFRWAMGVGAETIPYRCAGAPLPFFLGLKHRIADRLVLSKLRGRLGFDALEIALSGSAPLSSAVHTFFLSMGVTLLEGYGLTETCPALTATRPGKIKVATVGLPFPGVVLKIAEDGEVLAKGPNITKGYLNRPDVNVDAFDADGWFHTGDLGSVDPDGFLSITGRKKELLKTSGGKYIAPVKLESRLKGLVFVQEAVVIGDNRNYCTALFSLDKEGLETWAGQQGVPADPSGDAVRRAIAAHVDQVNQTLASFETVKKFRVLPEPMSVENGVLTASLKVKRRVVEDRYRRQIEEMYSGAEA
ncbi:MAG: long-chain fatty acid--CoA ligase [Deltaproteobacteria bacterium]|nr:long-chain fatty acid--CoA ligase [Deltaproteobacteria bacterium]